MKKIFVLSGTTEGRMYSDALERAGVRHIVSVASEYGKSMMEDANYRTIHVGRMDESAMENFLKENDFEAGDTLVDATHPYATEVSSNAKIVSERMGLSYLRIKREKTDLTKYRNVKIYDSAEACSKALSECADNILLTFGSKEIEVYANTVSEKTLQNTYVRVLPTVESMEKCIAFGISESHILALQGPFDEALNEAILRQFGIRHLITKESGKEGGFEEKIKACEKLGVITHVIARPEEESGVSVAEALQITGFGNELNDGNNLTETDEGSSASMDSDGLGENEKLIILAGAGMGSRENLTAEVTNAAESADVLFGAKRLTEIFEKTDGYPYFRAAEVLDTLKKHPEYKKAVVLFSGDSGFYSGAKAFTEDLKELDFDGKVKALPGISSVSYLAAKCFVSYEDASIYSLHGRFSEEALYELGDIISHSAKTFVLFSNAAEVQRLAGEMERRKIDGELVLGISLSSDKERIVIFNAEDAKDFRAEGSITGLVRNFAPEKKVIIPMLSDSDFLREKVPMTKEVIRHESIRRLGLKEGDLVYDIGGGTGSVAIEAALLHPSLRMVTIEKKEDAIALLRKNAELHGAKNVRILEGDASELLQDLEKPDCVFIGGSGGKLKEIVRTLTGKGEGIRFVLNAVTMETIKEAEAVLEEYAVSDYTAEQISVSSVDSVGAYHMLKAQNPVMIYSFTI